MVTGEGSRSASAEQRLEELGIDLPAPAEPFGATMRLSRSPHSTRSLLVFCMALVLSVMLASSQLLAQDQGKKSPVGHPTFYRTIRIDGLSIFYREAGPKDAPTLLLLHGFTSSSRPITRASDTATGRTRSSSIIRSTTSLP